MNCNSFHMSDLVEHFLSCTPINALDVLIPKAGIIDVEVQREILYNTIYCDLIKKYPVKQSYQRAFLKWIMKKIEDEHGKICDDIYVAYCNLLSSTADGSTHYCHYLIDNDRISIQESTNIISQGTTGLCCWQAAIELSKWCTENKSIFYEKVILEIGCGVGLTGLYIIKKCFPKQYVFSDCHLSVLEVVIKNIKLNLLHNEREAPCCIKHDRLKFELKYNDREVQVMELKWDDISTYLNEQWNVPDIIIGADILYDVDSFPALVSGIKSFLTFENRLAIIAATIRNTDTYLKFLHQLDCHELSFEEYNMAQVGAGVHLPNLPIKILKIFQSIRINYCQ